MSIFAVVATGSKQYRVEPQSVIDIEKLKESPDTKEITLENVLLLNDGKKVQVGNPLIKGAKVVCENLGTVRGEKLIAFTYRRRKASARKVGHRQSYLRLRVKKIEAAAS